jgi:hypothetical protein
VRALLAVEGDRLGVVWEPACGPGAIVRVLREAGHKVIASDLINWGCEDSESGCDFLKVIRAPLGITSIVTNPPFNLAEQFVAHALRLHPRVFMLLRGAFLEGLRWYSPDEHRRGKGFGEHLVRGVGLVSSLSVCVAYKGGR